MILHCLPTLPHCQLPVQLCICICVVCAQAAGWKPSRNWHNSQAAVSAVTSFVPVRPLLIMTLQNIQKFTGLLVYSSTPQCMVSLVGVDWLVGWWV